MDITPDSIVYWRKGWIVLNATIVNTWIVMVLLVAVSLIVTSNLRVEGKRSRWQNFLEALIGFIRSQINEITLQKASKYLPFLGSLYLFIALSNLMSVIPGFYPPTGSLHTTGTLAVIVFFAVPYYSIQSIGFIGYLKQYIEPTIIMLPFNIIGDLSRTLALAVRLFGNMLSGTMIGAVLLIIAPLFVPVVMNLLDLLIGQIHAYIFAVLAAVYIGSATRSTDIGQNETQERKV